MMKMIVVVFACLVAASSGQLLTSLGSTTYSHESTAQQHSPWAASASSRSQVHGPDATLLAAAPIVHAPLLAAAPAIEIAPISYSAYAAPAGLPIAYLRR